MKGAKRINARLYSCGKCRDGASLAENVQCPKCHRYGLYYGPMKERLDGESRQRDAVSEMRMTMNNYGYFYSGLMRMSGSGDDVQLHQELEDRFMMPEGGWGITRKP